MDRCPVFGDGGARRQGVQRGDYCRKSRYMTTVPGGRLNCREQLVAVALRGGHAHQARDARTLCVDANTAVDTRDGGAKEVGGAAKNVALLGVEPKTGFRRAITEHH